MKSYPIAELISDLKFLNQVENDLDQLDRFNMSMMTNIIVYAHHLIDMIEQASENGDDFSTSLADLEMYIELLRKNYDILMPKHKILTTSSK